MNHRRIKVLGLYVLAGAVSQIVIYLAMSLWKGTTDWLIYFDLRVGLFYLESSLSGQEAVAPTLLRWASAFWLCGVALCLLSGRMIKVYIISELLLSIPNILFVLDIVWANLNPTHGFSIAELC